MDHARIAYETYNQALGVVDALEFDLLPEKTKRAWLTAAAAITKATLKEQALYQKGFKTEGNTLLRPDGTPQSLGEARIGTNG